MTDERQPTVEHGPKPVSPGPDHVATPLGEVSVSAGFMASDDAWCFETSDAPCGTRLGEAAASFHIDGEGSVLPTRLRLVLSGGSEHWGTARGAPLERDGKRVAWIAHASIDPLTGKIANGREVVVRLSEFDAPAERRVLGIRPPSLSDAALEAEVEAEARLVLDAWRRDFPGYAARIHSARLRRRQADVEAEVEAQRAALLATSWHRDECARMARAAERVAQGQPATWALAPAPARDTPVPHVELRGFAGAKAFDAANLDEVVVTGASMVHLETMDAGQVWIGIYLPDGRRLAVNVHGKALTVGAEIDDTGLD
jgi:hypothetical protein